MTRIPKFRCLFSVIMQKKIKGVYDDALNLRKCSLCDNNVSAPYSVIGKVFVSVSGPLHPGNPLYTP